MSEKSVNPGGIWYFAALIVATTAVSFAIKEYQKQHKKKSYLQEKVSRADRRDDAPPAGTAQPKPTPASSVVGPHKDTLSAGYLKGRLLEG